MCYRSQQCPIVLHCEFSVSVFMYMKYLWIFRINRIRRIEKNFSELGLNFRRLASYSISTCAIEMSFWSFFYFPFRQTCWKLLIAFPQRDSRIQLKANRCKREEITAVWWIAKNLTSRDVQTSVFEDLCTYVYAMISYRDDGSLKWSNWYINNQLLSSLYRCLLLSYRMPSRPIEL